MERQRTIEGAETPDQVPALAAQVARLVESGKSPSAFYREFLGELERCQGALLAALEVRLPGSVVEQQLASEEPRLQRLAPLVQSALTDALAGDPPRARLLRSQEGLPRLALLSTQLPTPESPRGGAVVALVPCATEHEAERLLTQLEDVAYLTLFQLQRARDQRPTRAGAPPQAMQKLAASRSAMELSLAITNNLRTRAECDQVAYARVNGRKVAVHAVSGLDRVKRRNPGIQRIEAAMCEALDHGGPLVVQPGGADERVGGGADWRLHRAWHESAGGACVASLPIGSDGHWIGVVSLRREASRPFDAAELERYAELVAPYAQGMELVERANRGLLEHLVTGCGSLLARTVRLEHWRGTTVLLALVALGAWLVLGSVPRVASAPAVVRPSSVRHVAAPFDGVLIEALVREGDTFRKGDLLARLATEELELERSHLLGELELARLEERGALSEARLADAHAAATHRASWEAQLAVVDRKLALAEVRAPFDGLVVEGDLRSRVGDRLAKGEELLRLSSSRDWRLELMVDERDVADVEPGLGGSFVSRARPEERQVFEVLRVSPHAEVHAGRRAYVAEARWDPDATWMRPGMEGFARVDLGRQRPWRAALGRVLDWLHLNFWL